MFILASVAEIIVGWTIDQQQSDVYLLRCGACLLFTLWGLVVFVLVGLLLFFHVYLVLHGQTTHEFLRSRNMKPLSTVSIISPPKVSKCDSRQHSTCCCYPSLLLPMWKFESGMDAELDLLNAEDTFKCLNGAL